MFYSAGFITILAIVIAIFYLNNQSIRASLIEEKDYTIINQFNHDKDAFTQGLTYYRESNRDVLYESVGLYGKSSIRKVDVQTGELLLKVDMDKNYFGEGSTIWKDQIIILTWKERKILVHDRNTLKLINEFPLPLKVKEGWGLTHNDTHLILSDGTSRLTFLDPASFKEVSAIRVKDERGNKVKLLNELEYVDGFIYSNVWYSGLILKINPNNGVIIKTYDLQNILMHSKAKIAGSEDVLNGIAYRKESGSFFVTGKLWPMVFEIKLKD